MVTARRDGTKAARLRHALLRQLAEHEQAGMLPTSARFLFYELEHQGIVSKVPIGRRRADQDLIDALMALRVDGGVAWEWIVDETRSVDAPLAADTVAEWLEYVLEQARVDPWRGEPPAIITESRSLAGVLRPLCQRYCVASTSTNGQCGGHLRTEVAPALYPGQRVGYLGDLDLSGGLIEGNTRRVLENLVGEFDLQRLAVTAEQVEAHGLLAIVKYDRRFGNGGRHEAVETEALRQEVIVAIVRSWFDALLPERLETALEREAVERERLAVILRGLR